MAKKKSKSDEDLIDRMAKHMKGTSMDVKRKKAKQVLARRKS